MRVPVVSRLHEQRQDMRLQFHGQVGHHLSEWTAPVHTALSAELHIEDLRVGLVKLEALEQSVILLNLMQYLPEDGLSSRMVALSLVKEGVGFESPNFDSPRLVAHGL